MRVACVIRHYSVPLLLLALLALSNASLRQAEAQSVFDRLTGRTATCQFSLFVWFPLPANATQRDRINVNSEMIRFCREFDPLVPGAMFPGQGFNCRLVFLGTSSLPSVQVTLNGCCESTVAKDLMFSYPGVDFCRDQIIGEDPNNINVAIIGVTEEPPIQPTPTPNPSPVPTVTVDPAGNDTVIIIRGVARLRDGFADWRFWVAFLLILLLMLLLLFCCLCYLCRQFRHDERNNAYVIIHIPNKPTPRRLPWVAPLVDDTETPKSPKPEPPIDIPVKPASVASSRISFPNRRSRPPLPLSDLEYSDSDDSQNLDRFYAAKNSIYAPSEARPTSFSTFGVTEPAGRGPRAGPDLDAMSDSTLGGKFGSPYDDVTLPVSRAQREGLGDDSSSDTSSILKKLPSGRRIFSPYE